MVLRLSPMTDNRRINAAAYGNDIDEIHSRFDDVNRSPINRYRRMVMTERSNAQTGPLLQRYNIVIITIIIHIYIRTYAYNNVNQYSCLAQKCCFANEQNYDQL